MHVRCGFQASLTALILSASAFAATAQSTAARVANAPARQPYTAEFKITQVQTLANGVTITREYTEVHAVDSQGRAVTSTTDLPTSAAEQPYTHVHVHNPEDGSDLNWDTRSKRARLVKQPVGEMRQGCWESDSGNTHMNFAGLQRQSDGHTVAAAAVSGPRGERPKGQPEDLGTTTIQGVEARGTRTVWTTPTGQIGNDAPLVRTVESWWSSAFGLLLREVSDDPRSGKHDRELVSIDLGEPQSSLFAPPDGYEIVTEELHQVPCQH